MTELRQARFIGLFIMTLTLIVAVLIGISFYAARAFERSLLPQLDQKMLTVGTAVNAKLERALRYGIPLERLPGVADFFGGVLAANPDLAYLAVTGTNGVVLYQRGTLLPPAEQLAATTQPLAGPPTARLIGVAYDLALPLQNEGQALTGSLHVGADAGFVTRQIRELLFDIAIVFIIAALVALELLPLIVQQNLATPMRRLESVLRRVAEGDLRYTLPASRDEVGRLAGLLNQLVTHLNLTYQQVIHQALLLRTAIPASVGRLDSGLAQLRKGFTFAPNAQPTPYFTAHLIGARMATFLFVFAAELSQPFMPLYIRTYAAALGDPPAQWLISLPLTIFTLTAALCMPIAGWRFDRAGSRRTFVEGALLMMTGLAGTGLAFNFYDLLGWRALTAVGYAFLYTACQGYVVANSPEQRRAQGSALFVSGLMAGSICGPAIGGILADRIGYTATFSCAAALALGAGLAALNLLSGSTTTLSTLPDQRPKQGLIRDLATNFRFTWLMLFAAIPAKLLLNGFLFFLVPLTLYELGNSRSEIGRVVMLYGLAALFLGPMFARLADRFAIHGLLIGAGGLLTGIGLAPMLFFPNTFTVLAGVLCLGVGQAMSISPQLALVTRICRAQITSFGSGPVLGFYRLIERLGGASGPLIVALFAGLFGYAGTMTAAGVLGIVTATLFSIGFLIMGVDPESSDPPMPQATPEPF